MEDPIVRRLFNALPSFKSIFEESYYNLPYVIFGELGGQIHDIIINGGSNSDFIQEAFYFFNELSLEKDPRIDNILVVGVYEGLYYNKQCNDAARSYLKGRGKELYDYWMVNGNIQARY